MRRVDAAFERLQPVALLPHLGDVAMGLRDLRPFESRRCRHPLARPHIGPDYPADRAIIATRRLLLDAVKTVQAGGNPPGADDSYYSARAIEKIFPRHDTWRQTVLPEMYAEELPVAAK